MGNNEEENLNENIEFYSLFVQANTFNCVKISRFYMLCEFSRSNQANNK